MPGADAPYIPPNIRAVYRRSVVVAVVAAVVAVIVLVVLQQALWGVFLAIGLGLGVLNLAMVQRAAAAYANRGGSGKKGFAVGSIGRLAVISVIAFGCAVIFQPAGIGAIVGVAAFQFIAAVVAAIPITKEVRSW
jgi:hypothetical protein